MEGLKPPPMSTEDMVGSGCCSATLMNSLQVRTGTLQVLRVLPFTGLGMLAWQKMVEWLGQWPALSSLSGEPSCDVK